MPVQTFILSYVLDLPIHKLVNNTPFSEFHPQTLPFRCFDPKSSRYPENIPGIFDIMYWDISKALEISGDSGNFIFQTQKLYLNDLMRDRTLSLRASRQIMWYIRVFNLAEEVEARAWENILLPILDPKVQSFCYLLAHHGLPTAHKIWKDRRKRQNFNGTPWCKYCQFVNEPFAFKHAEIRHIFAECPIATNTWHFINTKLELAGIPKFEVNDGLVFMRLGLSKSKAFFASEVLWALWTTYTYNHHNITGNLGSPFRDQSDSLSGFVSRMKFLSKMDRDIIKSKKTYESRWKVVNDMINLVAGT